MALIKCNECGHKVSDKAKTCPKCGVGIEEMQLEKQKAKKQTKSKIAVLIIFVLVLYSINKYHAQKEWAALTPEQRTARIEQQTQAREQRRLESAQREAQRVQEEDEKRCTSGSTAYVMSQQYVRQRLKSPTTATFPGGSRDYQTQYMGDCIHRVVAYVDSQNSFGAMIRTQYYAEMQYIRNSRNKWRLLDLKIQ